MNGVARQQSIEIAGPAGRLQALLSEPRSPGLDAYVVLCHPHPLHGGTMNNKVVHTLARGFDQLGLPVVRFNFRGVGESGGEHDEGRGEVDDLLAVADWGEDRWPGATLWLAGFSFGAMVAVRGATRRATGRLVTVAPPLYRFDPAGEAVPSCPWLIIQGDEDELVDVDEVVEWINAMPPGPELVVIDGVDHFFHGRLAELKETLVNLLTEH